MQQRVESPSEGSSRTVYISRLPVRPATGVYGTHKRVYEAVGRNARPIWRRFDDVALVVASAPGAGCETKVYDPRIGAGQRLRFDLLAQVTVDRDGKRRDPVLEARLADPAKHYDDIAREVGTDWLRRREEIAGFRAEELHATEYDVMDFVRPQDRRGVRLGVIRFTGVLRCVDSERMRKTLLFGMGHGKAWGCGLLLVAR